MQVNMILRGDIQLSELSNPLYERLERAVLLVSEVCKEAPKPQIAAFTEVYQRLSDGFTWSQASTMECAGQYQTSSDGWGIFKRKPMNNTLIPLRYTIGEDQCGSPNFIKIICNGPLKPGTDYALIVRIILSTGFVDMDPVYFSTKSDLNLLIIVSAVLYTIFLISMVVCFVVRNNQRQLREAKQTDGVNEPVDISVAKFVESYERLVASNEYAVADEYEMIDDFSERFANGKMKVAAEKGAKNRYLNVLPFDFNRVLLNVEEETEGASDDYINASFIDGHKSQREYIATQGPMAETCYDFWRMVLQYEIESIVMLTQTVDHEKNKCSQYYPLANQTVEHGDIQVKCTEETKLTLYNKRLLMVSKGNQSKVVTHYHYPEWPDHSCPASPEDLMKFVMIVRSERKNKTIPLVVHCSAGVGRTGTFMALDILLQRIKREKKINVYATVKRLRRQRVKMVQTLEQYTFLYQCCLEYVNKPIKSSIINIAENGEVETNRQVVAATKRALNRMKAPLETSFKVLMSKVERKEQGEAKGTNSTAPNNSV
ncbi:AGAP011650-PA-like protein [Anopheles sinensis]|uniref:protein-tyrosine-phosphatase n=1 Tax=Anopheles sinensis TaxID=74873 RepID=A0A084VIA3_ANOSI|nr:AGAP011650-PA-like protein [Anopheles sinensis]